MLAGTITFVAENMGVLAASALTLGAAYGGRKILDFTKDLWDQITAIRSAQSAEIGRTAAQLDAASMAVRRAAAETIAAEAQVAATKFTDGHAAALSRLRLARLADAQAAAAQTAAQAANNSATSLAARAGRGLFAAMGGLPGLGLTIGAVAASYLLFRDNSEQARKATVDLKRPVEDLRKEFAELGKEQARYKLAGVLDQQADAQAAAQKALREIRASAQPRRSAPRSGALVELPYPTCDTLLMTRLATDAVERIFRAGFRYSKAEVLLMDLRQPGEFSEDLFTLKQSVACDRLMQVMDNINERWGRGAMRAASVPATPDWGMRREMMSQSYTTRIDQLWTVKC